MAKKENVLETETDSVENENVSSSGNGTVETVSKRQAKASATYVLPDGSERNFPDANASVIRITSPDETVKRDIDISMLPDNVKACAVLQGVVTRLQRGYQNLKDVDEVFDKIDAIVEELEGGIWLEVGTGEPRVTNLVTAIIMAIEAKGEVVDAARKASIIDKLGDENKRKEARAFPEIAANLATLARQSAEKKEAEKLAAARASGEDATAGF